MKKFKYIILPILLIASGCNNVNTDNVTVLCPTGAPSLAFYNHADDVNFQTNSSPANIVASMTENGTDFVVIDTIKGVSAIQNGAPYKLAANLTFGNFYIASTGNDDNNQLDKDDVIVSFGKGQTPEKVFNLLYGNDYTNIQYVDNVQMAAKSLISKKTADGSLNVDYVFVAEPVLTNCLKQNKDASIYANIQEIYQNKTNSGLIQAGLFVKNTVEKSVYKTYLNDLKEDVNALLSDSSLITTAVDKVGEESFTNKYSIGAQVAISCLNNNNSIGLGFKYAYENKESLENFCNLFNLGITENEILQIK